MKSKILFFSVSALFFLAFMACEDKFVDKHIIPYVPVNTKIELWMPEYQDLKTPSQPVYIKQSNLGKPLGYNENGIIVMKIGNDDYKSFDATCTRCVNADTHIEIKKGDAIAQCPTCKTKFLLTYGYPLNEENESDDSKIYPLREYPVIQSGNTLIISY